MMAGSGKSTKITCPYCTKATLNDVVDSRAGKWKEHYVVRRRRQCQRCDNKFTTIELPLMYANEYQTQIQVIDDMIEMLKLQKEDLHRTMLLAMEVSS